MLRVIRVARDTNVKLEYTVRGDGLISQKWHRPEKTEFGTQHDLTAMERVQEE